MYLRVNVTTGSKTESVARTSDDRLDLKLREKPERNLANNRVLAIVRALYPKSRVRIVSGHHSPHKIVSVEDSQP